jgi:hypothetical protein
MSQLFVVRKLFSSNTVYISGTLDVNKRIYSHIDLEPTFDMTSHSVYLFTLVESKYNAYQLQKIIQRMSNNFDTPYQQFSGSNNHYHYNTIYSLCDFLDTLNVKYINHQLNVDELCNVAKSYTSIECQEFILDDIKRFEDAIVSSQDYSEIEDLYMKDCQLEDINTF